MNEDKTTLQKGKSLTKDFYRMGETTLQPGKPRADQYGIETLRIAITDLGMLHVTFDNQTGTMRLTCHNYGDSKKLELVKYDKDGVTLKF